MDEGPDIRHYFHLLWQKKVLIIACMLAAFGIGSLDLRFTKPSYSATSIIRFEQSAPRVFEFGEVVDDTDTWDRLQTHTGLIASPGVAELVINSLGLYKEQNAPADDPGKTKSGSLTEKIGETAGRVRQFFRENVLDMQTVETDPEQIRKQLRISSLLEGLKVSQRPKTYLVEISYTSADPNLAKKLSDEFARQYINFLTELDYRATEKAREIARDNIDDVRKKMEEAKQTLLDYEVADIKLLEMRKSIAEEHVKELNNKINAQLDEKIRAEADAREMKMFDEQGVFFSTSGFLSDLRKRLNELELQRVNLVAEARPNHPELVQAEREIALLNDQVTSATAALHREAEIKLQIAGETLEQYKTQLADAEKELEFLSQSLIQHDVLQSESDTYEKLMNQLLSRYNEMTVASTAQSSRVSIIAMAEVPRFATEPKITRTLAIYLFGGMLLGVGLVLLGEQLDRSVKNPKEIEDRLGLPTLGVMPFLEGGGSLFSREKRHVQLISELSPKSQPVEAFRYLRTAIQYSSAGNPPQVMLVTSTGPGEGKSTASANLSITIARRGEKTLLIDADMKKPMAHAAFRINRRPGLSDLLADGAQLEHCLQPSKVDDNLWVISAGPGVPSPADLLDSEKFSTLLAQLRQQFTRIIIDSPPLYGMADSFVLAQKVDGLCLVIRRGKTRRDVLARVVEVLDTMDARIIGAVYNAKGKDDNAGGEYGAYDYSYEYSGYFDTKDSPKGNVPKQGTVG